MMKLASGKQFCIDTSARKGLIRPLRVFNSGVGSEQYCKYSIYGRISQRNKGAKVAEW